MSKIVEIAKKEIGYVESPGNKTKYGEWFGLDGLAWCAIFVSWIHNQAGIRLPKVGFSKGFASCQLFYEYAKKNNLITTNPEPGDIVLFDWNKDKRYDHTGIFERWIAKDVSFKTIEGNTSIVNQSNGGSVMSRNRTVVYAIFVKIRP